VSYWIIYSANLFKNTDLFINKTHSGCFFVGFFRNYFGLWSKNKQSNWQYRCDFVAHIFQ